MDILNWTKFNQHYLICREQNKGKTMNLDYVLLLSELKKFLQFS